MKKLNLSVTGRLILGFSIFWAAVLLVFYLVAHDLYVESENQKLDYFLESDLDSSLELINSFASTQLMGRKTDPKSLLRSKEFSSFMGRFLSSRLNKASVYKTTFALFGLHNEVLFESNRAIDLSITDSFVETLILKKGKLVQSAKPTPNGPTYRLASALVFDINNNKPLAVVQIACLQSNIDQNVRKFDEIISLSFSLLYLLTIAVTYLLTLGLFRPISRLRKATSKLLISRSDSRIPILPGNDEIAKTSRIFNQVLAKIEASRDFESKIIEDLSHQLRTPIALIKSRIELFKLSHRKSQKVSNLLDSTLEDINKMADLLRVMLNLAKIESGSVTLNLEPTNLIVYILDIVDSMSSLIAKKQIEVNFDLPVQEESQNDSFEAEIDRFFLEEAVSNILINAIQYAPEKTGRIEISFESSLEGVFQIDISNNGPPIDDEQVTKIFSRFYFPKTQEDGSKHRNGFGLGLNIAKSIVELHGGRLTAFNSNFGCTFRMCLGPQIQKQEQATQQRTPAKQED